MQTDLERAETSVSDTTAPGIGAESGPDRVATTGVESLIGVALAALPGVAGASLSVPSTDRRVETFAASPPVVLSIDRTQYENGGPCVDAISSGEEVRSPLPADKWPAFSKVAIKAGFATVWSVPVMVAGHIRGALNLYYEGGEPWSQPSSRLGPLLAAHTGAIMAMATALSESAHVASTLGNAVETRTIIGQAQGVLIARQGITADEAFEILRRASQRTNRKLREIAAEIVEGVIHNRT